MVLKTKVVFITAAQKGMSPDFQIQADHISGFGG